MFKEDYKTVADKFQPSQRLIENTVNAVSGTGTRAPRLFPRLMPAVAAVLVAALALAAVLLPRSPRHSFTLTASAAENTPLRDDTYVEIGELRWMSEGYSPDHLDDEFLTDISVSGEDIESITYHMNSGKLGLLDNSTRLTDYTGKTDKVYHNHGAFSAEGYSYYDSVTCAYDDRITAEDGLCITVQGGIGTDFDAKTVLHYMNIQNQLIDADTGALDVTADEVYDAEYAYFNEVLKNTQLLITVTYTDGSTDTQAVSFRADCTVKPVYRQFYAYALDENGEPYPVHSMEEAYLSFEQREEFDWEQSEDYNKVKDIFTKDDLIGFDDYETTVTLSAKIAK